MPDTNTQIEMLKQQLEAFQVEFYKNNFSGSQDFNKKVRLNTAVRLPVYGTAPAKCEQGELYVNSGTGKLYVCSSSNTWSLVGTQA
jgi:hypothetical protein